MFIPSVFCFFFVTSDDDPQVVLQFGRIGPYKFNLDFQFPLNAIQAFGIALSSFDYQSMCEA